jgi:transcription initiation factor IIE alpha subunit
MKATSQAKRETYVKQVESGNLNSQTIRVLHYVRYNPLCDTDELRTKLEMAHQSVTAVISNLLDLGLITIVGEISKRSQVYSVYRYVNEPHFQKQCATERKKEKFKTWIRQGKDTYGDLLSEELQNALQMQEIIENDTFHQEYGQGKLAF